MSVQTAPVAAPVQVAPVVGAPGAPGAPQPYISASLYVGDLHPDVIEATLYEAFSTIGHVASVRVCRDAITRRSLGYGYVNYHSFSDAERALELLNYTPLKERPMRIMWVQRDPSSRRSGPGNVFIKNLAKTIDIRTFSDTFSAFGNILSCKIALDEQGKSKGYGFIHYETAEMAEKAIKEVNGMLLENKKVSVVPFRSRRERESDQPQERPFTNLFVKELEAGTTLEHLKAAFGKYGEITSAALPTKEDGAPKGFAFVCFKTPASAKAALDDAANIVVSGKTPYIARHQQRDERTRLLKQQDEQYKQSHRQALGNLYIKNLDEAIDDDKLRQAFASFGTITSCKIMRDTESGEGRSRGFGFVCFASADDATRAAQEMNGRMLSGKPLYVALHQRKDVRRAQLEAQYAQRLFRRMEPGMPGMYPPQYMGYPPQGRQFYPMIGRPAPGWRQPNPAYMQGPGAMPPQMAGMPRQPRQAPPTGVPRMPKPQTGPIPAGAPAGVMPKQMGQPGVVNQQRGPASGRPVQYTRNVRNQGQSLGQPIGFQQIPGQEPLTPSVLAAATQAEQKNMLGERLYPLVYQQQGDRAGKITGMLLEMDNSELLILLESQQELLSKISEAVAVLDAHTQSAA